MLRSLNSGGDCHVYAGIPVAIQFLLFNFYLEWTKWHEFFFGTYFLLVAFAFFVMGCSRTPSDSTTPVDVSGNLNAASG